ncbi:penicillin-binding protein activator [Polycladidibacter hongkongensis]|uniref:penicillin-binding protein activator n=1 Tax=Polycladidibacter hongkongensis TaxID=1647556 RepID=UPI0008352C09|nr:penicillin-binding protein activator [Pseudovibrio hongkongensis]
MSDTCAELPKKTFASAVKAATLGAMALLAGCMNAPIYEGPSGQERVIEPVATGQTIGGGQVHVALLLPYSGQMQGSASVASTFENAARMALADFQGADIKLLVKDTQGTQAGAEFAAQAAIAEGAELIIGPVYSQAVRGASMVARRSNVPIIGFSSDTNVAAPGTYLLSFLPESDVNRIVSFAHEQERSSYAALLPNNSYGAVVEAAFRQAVGRVGGRIVTIERYAPGNAEDIRARVNNLSSIVSQVDSLYIPEGGGVPPFVMQVLTEKGASTGAVKLLGSGLWNTSDMMKTPVMAGSWFPAPDNSNYDRFAGRYQQAYGVAPPRNASLAYDATILAAGLVRSAGMDRFSQRVLTNADGFLGIDGVFRFQPNGRNERGLAIYEINGRGDAKVASPAPRTFSKHF